MLKAYLFSAVLFLIAIPAQAQNSHPKVEIFGGYSYLNAEFLGNSDNLNGFAISIAGNINKNFGLVADFSGHYGSREIMPRFGSPFTLDISVHTFLFGPRVSSRGDRVSAFAHMLIGGTRRELEDLKDTSYAGALGGGVDVKVNKKLALRIVQIDYIPARYRGDWVHDVRVQAGLVFRFGGS